MTRPNLQVNLKTLQRKWRIDSAEVRKYLGKVWKAIGNVGAVAPGNTAIRFHETPAEVTIVLLNDPQIRRYNKDYRKKDYPTDVLSFPVNEMQDGVFYLGDILISMERTAFQAKEKKHSTKREFQILILHGMLHLLGYDHEVDHGQMDRLERRLRKTLLNVAPVARRQ